MENNKWMAIQNEFIDESGFEEGYVVMSIDAWITNDENEEGKVIAEIKLDLSSNETTVTYKDEDAKTDSYAQEMIREGIETLKEYNE